MDLLKPVRKAVTDPQLPQSSLHEPSMIDEDWEEWSPEKGSFLHHMMAGSAAGVAEHVSIFPIDTIKTHMQCEQCHWSGSSSKSSALETLRRLLKEEGPLRLFRGVSTMLGASLPAHALYFSIFEYAKRTFGANRAEPTPFASGAAGVCGTICHDLIMTPMDLVKQRLQLGYYSGVWNCMKTITRTEGLRAFYISFPTTLLMNLPYSMIMVSANESFKKMLNPTGEMNVIAYLSSGAAAGALAGALTNPLDVAKTRLQTQNIFVENEIACHQVPCKQLESVHRTQSASLSHTLAREKPEHVLRPRVQYRGLVDTLIQIGTQEGIGGYFRGVCPRLLLHAPSVAISWTTFEVLKKILDPDP
ncbi:unnamed protein product [Albugo candida]|uniref:Mitochondrial carrier protein n=1 Tax=Albugo candida TaxID=65357 RepID=A0A024GCU6_9STRA|nr:unnamed protein product [Albugo candida]|eukprot:CCI44685.1 unnamed protein product [Albugo candida]